MRVGGLGTDSGNIITTIAIWRRGRSWGRQWWSTTGCFRDTLLGSGDIIDGDVGTALRAIVGSWGTSIVGNDTFTRVGFITRDQWRGRRRGSYSTITTT